MPAPYVTLHQQTLPGFAAFISSAGIGGWELALRLAGWQEDEEVWTGSCPCQPFSVAGKLRRNRRRTPLVAEFFRLVKACRPRWAMGEQVSSKDGLVWLDGVFNDLEAEGYTCWAVDTCAAGVRRRTSDSDCIWWPEVQHGATRRAGRFHGGRQPHQHYEAKAGDERQWAGVYSDGSRREQGGLPPRPHDTGFRYSAGSAHRLEHAPSDGRDARGLNLPGERCQRMRRWRAGRN